MDATTVKSKLKKILFHQEMVLVNFDKLTLNPLDRQNLKKRLEESIQKSKEILDKYS